MIRQARLERPARVDPCGKTKYRGRSNISNLNALIVMKHRTRLNTHNKQSLIFLIRALSLLGGGTGTRTFIYVFQSSLYNACKVSGHNILNLASSASNGGEGRRRYETIDNRF